MADAQRPAPNADTPGMDEWRRIVAALKGRDPSTLASHTIGGVPIEPLYERRRDPPHFSPRKAGPWTIVQTVDNPDPDRANDQAREDVEGGATGLALSFAGGMLTGASGLASTAKALAVALDGIDLAAIHIRIEPHARGPDLARTLEDFVAQSGVAPELASIAFGLDPIVSFASNERTEAPECAELVARFQMLRAAGFRGSLAVADGQLFHEAGASEAQELAAILAASVWWLRALENAGEAPDIVMPFLGASIAVDRDQFLSLAKLRALRLLWRRLQELCGVSPILLQVHAATSRRMMTRADPHTNLLRTTIAAFTAAVGGADSIAILPFDAAIGASQRGARALARNIQHLLMTESQLFRIADPAAGSGAFEALTSELAERSWQAFQDIEREGGIVASLRAGKLQSRIAASRGALKAELAAGRTPLVGSNIHRDPTAGDAITGEEQGAASIAGLAPIRLEAMTGPSA